MTGGLDKFLNIVIPLAAISFFFFTFYSQPRIKVAVDAFTGFIKGLFNKEDKGGGYNSYDNEVVYVPRERPDRKY